MSENKTLCHPASVDSLSTSAGTEDHVSMGGFAARKALQVVRNVEKVIKKHSLNKKENYERHSLNKVAQNIQCIGDIGA